MIVATAAVALIIAFAWPALIMGAVLLGIETPGTMFAVIVAAVILLALALRERLSGRRL
jgi:TRAP-type C4-dicarboxylate transport system permease large subunit